MRLLPLVTVTLALAASSCGGPPPPQATHGVAAGDVTHATAVIWARADRAGTMLVEVDAGGEFVAAAEAAVTAQRDFAGKVVVDGLRPGTLHTYAVRFRTDPSGSLGPPTEGTFRTAPRPGDRAPVRFAWSGDLAGQNVCRDALEGFPIFAAVRAFEPEFFIGLGDMIYADDECAAVGMYGNDQVPGAFGPATDLEGFRAHWRYNREDEGFRALLGECSYYGIWDDHEVVNDFGPHHHVLAATADDPAVALLPLGRRAFLEYTPIREQGERLHRSFRWGRHLEVFVLDTRQYRDSNATPDTGPDPKTLLGAAQRDWFVRAMSASDATWKLVVSSVPICIPTGSAEARDGWSDFRQDGGFERELLAILSELRDTGVKNHVWITTDVHFATAFRYRPLDDDPDWELHEFVVGPLNAGLFPKDAFDRTLGPERLFSFGPEAQVETWSEARGWMNFGAAEIDAEGRLLVSVRDVDGRIVFETELLPR